MNEKSKNRALALGLSAFLVWLLVFSAGVLISSKPYRDALLVGQDILANFLPATLVYTPINAAILSAIAGLIGGCASNLVSHQRKLEDREEAVEAGQKHSASLLEKRLAYMTESPFLSLLRGFAVYLTFLAGILIATDDPFKDGSSVQFMRYAGFVSLVAFGMGYDPTRFEQLLDNIPTVGIKDKTKKTGKDGG